MKKRTATRFLAFSMAFMLTAAGFMEPFAETTQAYAGEPGQSAKEEDLSSEAEPVITPLTYWDYHTDELSDGVDTHEYIVLDKYKGPASGKVTSIMIPAYIEDGGREFRVLLKSMGGVERKAGAQQAAGALDDLEYISCGEGLEIGGAGVFAYCYNVKRFYLGGAMPLGTVTDFSRMFKDCKSARQIDFCTESNTENLTALTEMFMGCSSLESLDLKMLADAQNATDVRRMFAGCKNLQTILSGGISILGDGLSEGFVKSRDNTVDGEPGDVDMFLGCENLVGGRGTRCDGISSLDSIYAVADSDSNTGYFCLYDESPILATESDFNYELDAEAGIIYLKGIKGTTFSYVALPEVVIQIPSYMSIGEREYRVCLQSYLPKEGDTSVIVNKTGAIILGHEVLLPEDATELFAGLSYLDRLDIRLADFSGVKKMTAMFSECSQLEAIDLEGIDTTSCVDMSNLFYGCSNLRYIYGLTFDTSHVTTMAGMFSGCSSVDQLDLSGFDTLGVKNVEGMFSACAALTTIFASDTLTADSVENKEAGIFANCNALKGGKGTTWSASAKDAELFRIDRGPDEPGLFTRKIVIRDISYPFANTYDGLKYKEGYSIPIARYRSVFGSKGDFMHYFYDEPWGGSCYGLSASSAMFLGNNGIGLSDYAKNADRLYNTAIKGDGDPDVSGDALKRFIEEMHLSQYDVRVQLCYILNEGDQACMDAMRKEKGKNPVIIGLFGPEGGHAVLAYDYEFTSEYGYIYIYDSNWPGETRKITFGHEGDGYVDGWYYDLGGEGINAPIWGTMNVPDSVAKESFITFIPYDIYSAVYMDKGLYNDAEWIIEDGDDTAWTAADEEAYLDWAWSVAEEMLYQQKPWTDEEEELYQELGGPVTEDQYNAAPWSDQEEKWYDEYGCAEDDDYLWADSDEQLLEDYGVAPANDQAYEWTEEDEQLYSDFEPADKSDNTYNWTEEDEKLYQAYGTAEKGDDGYD